MRTKIVSLVVVAVAASACGGSSPSGTPTTVSSSPASSSNDAIIAQFLTKSAGVKTFKLQMVMDFQGAGEAGNLIYDGEVDVAKRLMHLSGSIGETQIEMILGGEVVYVKLPPEARQGNKAWTKTDVSTVGSNASGAFMSNDPGDFFAQVRAAAPDLKKEGSANVRGRVTTVFGGTIDYDKLVERASPERREQIRKAGEALGESDIPMKIYVGADGLLYRQEITFVIEGNEVKLGIDVFDYGAPVKIKVPPADQVQSS